MNRTIWAATCLAAVVCAGSGCGSSNSPAPGTPQVAGGNSRIKFKEEYKQMLDKDGKLLSRPSQIKKKP